MHIFIIVLLIFKINDISFTFSLSRARRSLASIRQHSFSTRSPRRFVVLVQRLIRYALLFHVHDHRSWYSFALGNSFKLSSPTLRKLCLPCITARHHSRPKSSSKVNARPHEPVRSPTRNKKTVVESFERFELSPRPNETATTAVHSGDYSRENNANNFHQSQQPSSHSDFAKEKKSEENSLGIIETQPTSSPELVGGESLLQSAAAAAVSNDDVDVVGILYLDSNPKIFLRAHVRTIKMIIILITIISLSRFSVMNKRLC